MERWEKMTEGNCWDCFCVDVFEELCHLLSWGFPYSDVRLRNCVFERFSL